MEERKVFLKGLLCPVCLCCRQKSLPGKLLAWDPVERRVAERLIPHKSVQFSLTSNYVIATSAVRGGSLRPALAPFLQHIRWFLFFSYKNKLSTSMKMKIKPQREGMAARQGAAAMTDSRGREGAGKATQCLPAHCHQSCGCL